MLTLAESQALPLQLLDRSNRADPYPVYRQLRERGPLQMLEFNLTVFSSFQRLRRGAAPSRGCQRPAQIDRRTTRDRCRCRTEAIGQDELVNPVVALKLLANGSWSDTGVLGPEAFDPMPFLDLLTADGSPWDHKGLAPLA